jgi:GDP-4-dehydro-6-deoxy-D-mannose reductase
MRVLITGAGGFVGGHLIRRLRDADPGVEIVGTVQPHKARPSADVRFVPCDIVADAGAGIRALVQECRPDRIYHLAGAASGAAKDREPVFRINVEGTRFVLEAARGIVAPGHILVAGTGYVYGNCDPDHPAREDDPLPDPSSLGVYAESKRRMEAVVHECGGAVIARAFNHTGPGQTATFAVAAFAAQIARIERGQQAALHVGNMEARRDFTDVRDVVRAYHLLLERAETGGVYNVCSGLTWRMQDVLEGLRAQASVPVPVIVDADRMRPSDIAVSVGDPSRLLALTGWRPHIPFAQTLQDTLDWWCGRTPPAGRTP